MQSPLRSFRLGSYLPIIIGIALTLIFPSLWLVTRMRPLLWEGEPKPPGRFFMYHALAALSDTNGFSILSLLCMLGFAGTLLLLRAAIPATQRLWRSLAVTVLFLFTMVFMIVLYIDWINPLYRTLDQISVQGQMYYLLEGEYRSGPSYQIIVKCDQLGLICHYETVSTRPVNGEDLDLRNHVESFYVSSQYQATAQQRSIVECSPSGYCSAEHWATARPR